MAFFQFSPNGRTVPSGPLLRSALHTLVVLLVATALVALFIGVEMELGWSFVAAAVSSLAMIFAFVLYLLPAHPHLRFGYANIITAFRASLVSLIAATVLCLEKLQNMDAVLWALVGVVLLILALDGVDGYLARRFHQESPLGARFDMEVDALLILILSIAAAMLEKAGAWVLLMGLMRYAFVAAGWLIPQLNRELPSSMRRKAICVVQGVALCTILVPWITAPFSTVIAAAALALLALSFALDVIYLLRPKRA